MRVLLHSRSAVLFCAHHETAILAQHFVADTQVASDGGNEMREKKRSRHTHSRGHFHQGDVWA